MENLEGFDFFSLTFDADGNLSSPGVWNELKTRARDRAATDTIFLAHGFRNDENDARSLYREFLKNFRTSIGRAELSPSLAARRFLVAGVFWPSKTFRESFGSDVGGVQSADSDAVALEAARQQLAELRELATTDEERAKVDQAMALLPFLDNNPDNQDRFVELTLSLVHERESDPLEGTERVKAQPGSELLDKLRFPIILPTERAGDDSEGGVASVGEGMGVVTAFDEGTTEGIANFVGSIFGRVGQFLNLTTWYIMKNRSGVVGANGVAAAVRDLKQSLPAMRVHLIGHSLGGRLVAACAKSLTAPPLVQVESLILLQAAFSHFGLSPDNGAGTPGFFCDIITKKVVRGRTIATFSFEDTVVGRAYAIASRLAGDNVKAIGDSSDPYGGIGRNGAQNLAVSVQERLHTAGTPYTFQPDIVHCLDGSGGLIRDHGDVRNENVTYAAAAAIALS